MKETKKQKTLKQANQSVATFASQFTLHYIDDYRMHFGQSPSLADIGQAFKRTRQWAKYQVDSLVAQGLVKRTSGKYRNIELIKKRKG